MSHKRKNVNEPGNAGSVSYSWACGVPVANCDGGSLLSARLRGQVKYHGSPRDARNCYIRHKLENGYTRFDAGTLEAPDGRLLILTKESRFGARLRAGKAGRKMPLRGGFVITSS